MITRLITYLAAAVSQGDCDADKAKPLLGIIPRWYKYLPYSPSSVPGVNHCEIQITLIGKGANPQSLLLILLGFIDMLLRVAGIVAVVFVMYGGFRYVTSQGEPENTSAALRTIINALIGVGIAVVASVVVAFVARSLG